MHDRARAWTERDDVALVGRRVADVAAGRRDHEPVREVQRGRDLLALRQQRDRGRPDLASVGNRELADPPVGPGRVEEAPARIRDRCRGRDPVRAGPRCVTRGHIAPEDAAGGRVDGHRLPIGRRDEERVVPRAADHDAVQEDRRGVGRAVELDALALQLSRVRGGDARRVRRGARAGSVVAEPCPVVPGRSGERDRGEQRRNHGESL